jgi:EAL domain-containing protein (putative c-di-GMP-specific phosphodiesterase class I)
MRNLVDTDLPKTVARLLAETGVEPHRLTLEITETNVMSDPGRTIDLLSQLSALGLRLSVDDFGTGYSSLAYLQRLPVDEVKVDKCFVLPMTSDPSAAAIVRSIIGLAHNLNLSVVAEGVEDRETLNSLRDLGCDQAQGYYLAKPMPAARIKCWEERLMAMDLCTATVSPMEVPLGVSRL